MAASLVSGVAIGQGLLIAAGLVLAGPAGHLFDPQWVRHQHGDGPSQQ